MKRKIFVTIIVFGFCLFAAGTGADQQPEKRVMNFLAVMDLNCGKLVGKDECNVLTDLVISELVKAKKYSVIDRANRDKILGEVGFQQTGCTDESCTVEAGRILGVGKIVVGNVTKLGETYIVSLQLINVETAAVENTSQETCKKCELDDLLITTSNAARKLMGQTPTTTIQSGSQPQPQPSGDGVGARIEWADSLKRAGQNSKAEEVLVDTINMDMNDPRAYFALGSLWLQMDDYTRAIPELIMAAFIAPDNSEYHHTLGKAYLSSGELESAVEEMRRARELDPKNDVLRRDLDMATASLTKYRKSTGPPPLEIVEVQINPVLASLHDRYNSNPIGKIALRNNGTDAIFNLRVSFQVRRFQPMPTTTLIDKIDPKTKMDVPLKAAFADSVLDLRNDTPMLGTITIEYLRKGATQRITTTAPFVLRSR